ncbi:hypothetical protein VE04_08491, partial [Pseudogymnoascus sp. 24MN13]
MSSSPPSPARSSPSSSGASPQPQRKMSASRLPLRSITAVLAAALSVGAWKSRPFVTKFLTGPGNYSRILALVVVLANYKNFPFVWH